MPVFITGSCRICRYVQCHPTSRIASQRQARRTAGQRQRYRRTAPGSVQGGLQSCQRRRSVAAAECGSASAPGGCYSARKSQRRRAARRHRDRRSGTQSGSGVGGKAGKRASAFWPCRSSSKPCKQIHQGMELPRRTANPTASGKATAAGTRRSAGRKAGEPGRPSGRKLFVSKAFGLECYV